MKKIILVFFLFINHTWAQENFERLNSITNLKRIAFGSCNGQFHEQPLWNEINLTKPDLFIWGGDNVYAETNDPTKIQQAFREQDQNSNYKHFKSIFPIIGTWDDHDFAFDNAEGSFPHKKESQQHFLDFIQEPNKSKRRNQQGIYTSYDFISDGRTIKIILLDNRYFKGIEKSAPLLGEAQWSWLENELKMSQAQLHFIVGGLSIFSPKLPKTEEWEDHPSELKRMVDLTKKYNIKAPVFLTGDKHFASIFQRHGHLEFMSSGLTHTAPKVLWRYLSSKYPNTFFGLNFGMIDIEWENQTPIIHMTIRARNSRNVLSRSFRWASNRWSSI